MSLNYRVLPPDTPEFLHP